MLNIYVDYPSAAEEYKIIKYTTTNYESRLEPLLKKTEILELLSIVRKVRISEDVMKYATTLARMTRVSEQVCDEYCREWLAWGAGPRAAQALIVGGKARAMLSGRFEVTHEDVRSILLPVFRHRIIPNYHAEAEGITTDEIVKNIMMKLPAPGWPPPVQKKKRSIFSRVFARNA